MDDEVTITDVEPEFREEVRIIDVEPEYRDGMYWATIPVTKEEAEKTMERRRKDKENEECLEQ